MGAQVKTSAVPHASSVKLFATCWQRGGSPHQRLRLVRASFHGQQLGLSLHTRAKMLLRSSWCQSPMIGPSRKQIFASDASASHDTRKPMTWLDEHSTSWTHSSVSSTRDFETAR